MTRPAFHLAFPVRDIALTRQFYVEMLGCLEGRCAERWIDFDFYGHQLSAHLSDQAEPDSATNLVAGKAVPVRHFGLILNWQAWHQLKEKLQAQAIDFLIEPHIRFAGEAGEQASFFILDPSANGLEFKAFRNSEQVFSKPE